MWQTGILRKAFILMIALSRLSHAAPPLGADDLPRIPPTAASQAIKTFQLRPGLRLELVASEPLIESPVGICFDEDGRLFVVEMRDYPDLRDQQLGRIKLLSDTRQDGHYDKATIYADYLRWPTSVLCYGGGVYVTASPDIVYFKDTRRDGVADQRKVVFTGFGITTDPLNVQGLVNNLVWGLDDRIQGTASFNGGRVVRPGSSDPPLDVHGRDFSFDARTDVIRLENGGGQHGLSFDSFGRKFVCMNDKPVETFMYDARYAARNPLYAMSPSLVEVNADGPDVYRISPEEAWRVLRTRRRVAGLATGPIEGGGRASGYFTGVSGIAIYTGDALPAEFRDNAFVGEVANNLVHREVIVPEGAGVVAHRAPDEQRRDFLASKDVWFRPVQLANGPDGALYVVDMYREVIEHPWSLPDDIRRRLNLHSGSDRGRIWRVVPDGFTPREPPHLSNAVTPQLVALLEHPNGWHRNTAARLLFERRDPAAVPILAKVLKESKSALGRLQALCALDGQGALTDAHVLLALNDPDAHVRERGLMMAERYLSQNDCPPALWSRVQELASDSQITVRYQLAFTLGESLRTERVDALARIARRDIADKWVQAAVLSSSAGIEAPLFALLADAPELRRGELGQQFLGQFARLIGQRHRDVETVQVVRAIESQSSDNDAKLAFSLARALREGMRRGGGAEQSTASLDKLLGRARAAAADPAPPQATRVEAVRLLGTTSYQNSGPILLPLLETNQPQALQLAAVESLDGFDTAEIASELIKRMPSFSPSIRSAAIAALLRRSGRAIALLRAIEAGKMHPSDVTTAQANFLRNNRDASVRDLARKLLAAAGPRQQVIATFQPALELTGDAARGRTTFVQRCAQCHRLGGEGFAVGPDLTTVRNDGKAKAMVNILDPNREVAPNYVAYLVESTSGESVLGIMVGETATSVTIRQPFGNCGIFCTPRRKFSRNSTPSFGF